MADEKTVETKVTKAEAKAKTTPKPKAEKKADQPSPKQETAPKGEAKPKAAEAKPKAAEAKPKEEAKPKAAEAKPKEEAKPKAAEAKPKGEAKPKAAEAKPKGEAKPKAEKVEIVEGEIEKEAKAEEKRAPRIKPVLTQELKWAIKVRTERKAHEPEFRRQEWFRYRRLEKTGYRKPRGMHSKMRMHWKYRPSVVRIGFRGPKVARGLHPSGFKEVLVHNELALAGIDPKTMAIRIGHSVGGRKRQKIQEKADELGIRVLNRW